MLDHNDIIRNVRSVNAWFLPMTFHVTGFLLLPFLAQPKLWSTAMVRDHAIRYLTPFLFAVLGYAIAFHIVVAHHEPPSTSALIVIQAILVADPTSLHNATGFIVLWFLPALLSIVLLNSLFASLSHHGRLIMIAVAVAVHMTVGGFSPLIKQSVPQGLLIALYVLPLGFILQAIMPWVTASRHRLLMFGACVALLFASWTVEHAYDIEVATLDLPTLSNPLFTLATDASDLSFLVAAAIIAPLLARSSALRLLGRYSLVIYLVHPLLYKPILSGLLQVCTLQTLSRPHGAVLYWSGAAASVVLVASVSLVLAMTLEAIAPVRRLVLPRNLPDSVFGGSKHSHAAH